MPVSKPEDVIVFLFLSLFIGVCVTYILTRLIPSMPYTVIVFAIGILFAFLLTGGNTDNSLSASVELWNSINPDLIFYLFLPPLLFGETMNLNFYHVSGAAAGSILLAGPGTVAQTFSVAAIIYYVLPYDWSWTVCLIFGSITSATDPVAVVSLLKKNGARNRLTYLIVGESLLNDGVALALFIMFFDWIQKDQQQSWSPADIAIYFIKFAIISPLLGAAFGFGTLLCLSVLNKRMIPEDNIMQISLTICCAYLSFYVAQHTLKISGALACCFAGLVLARFANPLIIKVESMRSVWEVLEWTVNTLIFILAGLIIGSGTISFVQEYDILYILLAYFIIFAVRAVLILISYPVLLYTDKDYTPKEAIFMIYSGLRGAVSVATALSLVHSASNNATTIDIRDARRVFFLSGGVAALTLLVNASTAGLLLKWLRLLPESSSTSEVRIMRQYLRKRLRLKALVLLEQLQEKYPDNVDPQFVWHHCSIFQESSREEELESQSSKISIEPQSLILPAADSATDKTTARSSCWYCCGRSSCLPCMNRHIEVETRPMKAASATDLHDSSPRLERRRPPSSSVNPSHVEQLPSSSHMKENHAIKSYSEIVNQKLEHIAAMAPGLDERSRMFITRQRQFTNASIDPSSANTELMHRFGLTQLESDKEDVKQEDLSDKISVESEDLDNSKGKFEEDNDDDEEVKVISDADNIFDFPQYVENPATGTNRRNIRREPSLFVPSSLSRNVSSPAGRLSSTPAGPLRHDDMSRDRPRPRSVSLSLLPSISEDVSSSHPIGENFPLSESESSAAIFASPDRIQSSVLIENQPKVTNVENILMQIRRAFLEIARVHYWRQIHSGRLPRKSQSILILLNSIEYALELSHTSGLDDWSYIIHNYRYFFQGLFLPSAIQQEPIDVVPRMSGDIEVGEVSTGNDSTANRSTTRAAGARPSTNTNINIPARYPSDPNLIRIGRQTHFDSVTNIYGSPSTATTSRPVPIAVSQHKPSVNPHLAQSPPSGARSLSTSTIPMQQSFDPASSASYSSSSSLTAYRHAQVVYLLVAFIEAHEYAQQKIRFYIGNSEGIEIRDENVVIAESESLVLLAKQVLSSVDVRIITSQLSKQAARWILHVQEDAIIEFRDEGVITGKDAEIMLQEVEVDHRRLARREQYSSKQPYVSDGAEIRNCNAWVQSVGDVILMTLLKLMLYIQHCFCCGFCSQDQNG